MKRLLDSDWSVALCAACVMIGLLIGWVSGAEHGWHKGWAQRNRFDVRDEDGRLWQRLPNGLLVRAETMKVKVEGW